MSTWQVRVTLLLTSDDAALLVRRQGDEHWTLPAALLTPDQQPEDVARAIARDQLGLDVPWVDLAWAETRREGPTLVLHYTADAPDYPQPAPDIAEARFFQVEHLPHLPEPERRALYRVITGG